MEKELTFIGHLEELRIRIIISLASLFIAGFAALPFAESIIRILKYPAHGTIGKLVYFGPQEAFVIYCKVAFMAGMMLAFPVVAFQFWQFIAPAIDKKFSRYGIIFLVFSSGTFFLGASFSYCILLPAALKFLLGFGQGELEPLISAAQYISFAVSVILTCGAVFQMPLLSFILTKIGLIDAKRMRSKFGIALIVISVASAILTPTVDVFNMIILVIPMVALYEVSIWVSWITGWQRA